MNTHKKHLLIFGNGYVASFLADAAAALGFTVTISSRTPQSSAHPTNIALHQFGTPLPEGLTHLVSTVPPQDGADPVLAAYPTFPKSVEFVGYLSSTGVYGDYDGQEVTEQSPLKAKADRSVARMQAEKQWHNLTPPAHIFRLSGIYGPGRNMLERVKAGKIDSLEKSERPVNRIHVDDICQIVLEAISKPSNVTEIYNVADDVAAPTYQVVEYAAKLLGAELAGDDTQKSHLNDGSRVVNCDKAKKQLGISWRYPTYKAGLDALYEHFVAAK